MNCITSVLPMGRLFSKAVRTLVPSGTVDLLPTLLHVLDYPIPPSVEGRILYEALAQPQGVSDSSAASHTYSADTVTAAGLYRQHLTTTKIGTTVYLERGWVE